MGVRSQILAGAVGVGAGALPIPGGVPGIPDRALVAYVNAARSPEACAGMRWQIVAGVYAQESDHGRYGGATIQPDGEVSPAIRNRESGAMGAGQFMPTSWALFGAGGDPDNIDDAAKATVRHLCGTHGDVIGGHLRSAIVSYYGADQDGYADSVLTNIAMYDRAGPAVTTAPPGGKERTIGRLGSNLWNATMRGWVRVGEFCGLLPKCDPVWRAADDGMFGENTTSVLVEIPRGSGTEADFNRQLGQLIDAAPGSITVYSGKRDAAEQLVLWNRAQAGTGAPADWSDGVNCESKHCAGLAADLAFGPGMEEWAHANAGRFGLFFPYAHEPWHAELAG